MPRPSVVAVNKIDFINSPCPRAELNDEVILEYAAHLHKLPPVVLYKDGDSYLIGDGWHRVKAVIHTSGHPDASVKAHVREGSLRDCLLYSVGANSDHGLRRTRADKRQAVTLLLKDAEWRNRSDGSIAEACRVSDHLVAKLRDELTRMESIPSRVTPNSRSRRIGRDGRSYNMARIGKTKAAALAVKDKKHPKPPPGTPTGTDQESLDRKSLQERASQEVRDRLKAGEKPEVLRQELRELTDRKLAEATNGGNRDAGKEQIETAPSTSVCEHVAKMFELGFASQEEDGVMMLWVSNRKAMTTNRELNFCPVCGLSVPSMQSTMQTAVNEGSG